MINIQRMMLVDNEHLYGPGKRLLIYLKGCSIHCEGCINPHLWSFDGGTPLSSDDILKILLDNNLDGVTLHGGEPLDQADELLKIVKDIKANGKTVILFTGYIKKELIGNRLKIWNLADIVVAGRFQLKKRNVYLQFRGSTNQRVYTHKGKYKNYNLKDGYTTAMFTIDENGDMDVNGFLTEDIAELMKNK